MPDFVPGLEDPFHRVGMQLGGQARDEEGGRRAVLGEQRQEPRHADLRPVRLMAHQHRVVRVAHVLGEHHALGVHVEGQDGEHDQTGGSGSYWM